MSQSNELSAEAASQAIGAKASVQEEQAQQFQALLASASNNQDPSASLSADEAKKDYSHLIGKKYVGPEEHEQLKAEGKGAVDSKTEFTKEHLPELHRVLGKNDAMTLDYRPDRLNVYLDEDSKCNGINWG